MSLITKKPVIKRAQFVKNNDNNNNDNLYITF